MSESNSAAGKNSLIQNRQTLEQPGNTASDPPGYAGHFSIAGRGQSVLPSYSVVVFDEAHELEDVATDYFGVMVSNYRLEELVRDTEKALTDAGSPSTFVEKQLSRLSVCTTEFFGCFRGKDGR